MADSQQATGSGEAKDEPVKELTAKQLKKQAQKDAKKAKFEKKMEGTKQQSSEVHHYYKIIFINYILYWPQKTDKKAKKKADKEIVTYDIPIPKGEKKGISRWPVLTSFMGGVLKAIQFTNLYCEIVAFKIKWLSLPV